MTAQSEPNAASVPANQLPPPPIFGVLGDDKVDRPGMISLVDIFDEFLFTYDRLPSGTGNQSNSTGFTDNDSKPFKISNVKDRNYLVGDDFESSDDDEDDFDDNNEDGKKRKRGNRGLQRNMTEEQKVERRERNREHARRSRVRKKFLLESLQHSVHALEQENEKLRNAIKEHLKVEADDLLASCTVGGHSVIATDRSSATRALDDPDYSLVKALQTAQQNFVISDPSLPDNPIVYASQGFLHLTGYELDEVLGRNCRFVQGPHTNPRSVDKIRQGIEKGEDTTVVLLNYRKDGSTFWNQFFIAALRDGEGNVVNYLGVQCKVSEEYAKAFLKSEEFEEGKGK